jgi:peroxiredoxin
MIRDIGKWLALIAIVAIAVPGFALAIEVGDHAPDFNLTDLQGIDHSLSAYSSDPVLLVFLSCLDGTSRAVAPLVENDVNRAYSSEDLTVLGIDCLGGTAEQLSQFWHETSVSFPLLMDGGMVQATYGVDVLSLVLIDGSGTVRYVSTGQGGQAYDRDAIVSMVELILAEANSSKQATWGLIKGLYSD